VTISRGGRGGSKRPRVTKCRGASPPPRSTERTGSRRGQTLPGSSGRRRPRPPPRRTRSTGSPAPSGNGGTVRRRDSGGRRIRRRPRCRRRRASRGGRGRGPRARDLLHQGAPVTRTVSLPSNRRPSERTPVTVRRTSPRPGSRGQSASRSNFTTRTPRPVVERTAPGMSS